MQQEKNRRLAGWISFAGLLTGSFDAILALLINYKIPASVIFKYIASGLFGATAFSMGDGAVLYGILIHYCIAFVWTIIFFFLYPKLLATVRYRFVLIPAIGLVIWVIMNIILLPLSAAHLGPFKLKGVIENMAALILAFGLPVIVIADKFYEKA